MGLAERPETVGDARLISEPPVDRQRLLQQGTRPGDVLSGHVGRKGAVVEGVGDELRIAAFPHQGQALVVEGLGGGHVALPVGDAAGRFQREGTLVRMLARARNGEHRLEPGAALAEVASHLPEPPVGAAEAHCAQGVAPGLCPVECGAKVVVIHRESIEPVLLVRAEQVRRRGFGQLLVCRRVAVAYHG